MEIPTNFATYTTASNVGISNTLTLDVLKNCLDILDKADPIRKFMLGKGFDPDKGDRLVLPYTMSEIQSAYITHSKFISEPVLIRAIGENYEHAPK